MPFSLYPKYFRNIPKLKFKEYFNVHKLEHYSKILNSLVKMNEIDAWVSVKEVSSNFLGNKVVNIKTSQEKGLNV